MSNDRNMTSKTVGPRQADSYGKSRQAAAKVQANADRVQALNDAEQPLVVLVPASRDLGRPLAHRVACKRLAERQTPEGGWAVMIASKAVAQGATPAGCCKPRLPEMTTEPTPAPEALVQPKAHADDVVIDGTPESTDVDRYAQALTARKNGARGKGKSVTDEELDAYIATTLAADPEASRNRALEVAYWLDGLALSRSRWNVAWEAAQAKMVGAVQ